MKECAVVVFGDIGRSPRMVNHSLELAENTNFRVNLFAYLDNKPQVALQNHPNIRLFDLNLRIVNLLKKLPRFLYLLYALFRIFFQSLHLFFALLFMRKQEFILVQNPPSLPVLHTVCLVKLIRRSKLIIDFHNYGHTILQLSLKNRIILKIASLYEHTFAKRFDLALCVSNAMQRDLLANWGINAITLYDKANICYLPISKLVDKHHFFRKLDFQWDAKRYSENETMFTYQEKDEIHLKHDRPALILSSTSWTEDEDFHILTRALDQYDEMNELSSLRLRKLYVVITGKGPKKEEFLSIYFNRNRVWKSVRVHLAWLEIQDYPLLLGCADVGICLHYSSSGLDLPMKVVDMFSVGTPVFAKNFPAYQINELVQQDQNGALFDTAEDLKDLLVAGFQDGSSVLQEFRKGIDKFREQSFDKEWREKFLPRLQPRIQ